jgi:AraC family transcriptional regulator, regulatory protein of adaptative response / methylated-DNA-[protein]-cysteine methyltransferase
MKQLSIQEMVRATMNRDTRYDGTFFVCVRTTMIYCLPSCKAKKPMLKNIVFIPTRAQALQMGFRGCKRCRAADFPKIAPKWLDAVIDKMKSNSSRRLSETVLTDAAGVDITTIRRYFKLQFGTTPTAFHRKMRLQHARQLIERGLGYLEAAFESGFESSSGFRDAFKKEFGSTPGRNHDV